MTAPRIELHIDEVVLIGVPGQRRALTAAMNAELQRGLADAWPSLVGRAGEARAHVTGADVALPGTDAALGARIARSILGGIAR